MGPQNVILGDNQGIDLPKAAIDTVSLDEERRIAKYTTTDEFKHLQDHFRKRIKSYQSFLPDGRPIIDIPHSELANKWLVANTIIAEFEAVINFYNQIATTVREADNARSTND